MLGRHIANAFALCGLQSVSFPAVRFPPLPPREGNADPAFEYRLWGLTLGMTSELLAAGGHPGIALETPHCMHSLISFFFSFLSSLAETCVLHRVGESPLWHAHSWLAASNAKCSASVAQATILCAHFHLGAVGFVLEKTDHCKAIKEINQCNKSSCIVLLFCLFVSTFPFATHLEASFSTF